MEQQEQVEWDDVNKLLQHHGFKPVHFADPVENKSLADLVLLDKRTAVEIRATLRVMLTDSERRQQLIQELIRTNSQLKEDVQSHMSRSLAHTQRASDLEKLLDQVRLRLAELEDRCVDRAAHTQGEIQGLQRDKIHAQRLVQDLEQTLLKQREEISELQRKLHFAVRSEEQRVSQQSQTFELICRRTVRQSNAHDQQILDVMDHYETKMSQLLEELRRAKGEDVPLEQTSSSVSPTFKTMIKAFKEEQKESRNQIEELKKKVEHLKQELETRPTLKELKFYKHKVRRIEKLYNLRLAQDENSFEIHDSGSDAALCTQYQQLLSEISAVVTGPKAPLKLHKQKLDQDSRKQFKTLLPTLKLWVQQLTLLKDLQQSLNKLSTKLLPWQPSEESSSSAEAAKVEDMMLLVDTLLENTSTDDEKVLRSPTRHTLSSMVSHFQKLFDVSSLSGVFPRMNEVYSRLCETNNAMRNIKDALNIDSRATCAEVVNAVTRLNSQTQTTVQDLLGEDDIDSIIQKVKDHDEFFPAFHSFIIDILQTLGLTRLDDILPALETLKQQAAA
ncbi:centrosomal protein of 70 kDa [Boleophthalmus pectinirostris]|uniref:centrosomal protein of 70 kDa n=1 Tax=Boleophthalmus pectinirostris TaxID=150288 RepID=UPI00242B297B|nr:centrosomal protein of 70 kDa [Boleophthalmus pectinirostris]XP_055021758.1 centrosomal protein of 70 kDa [Boleophthalmus pectinirostris]